VKHDLNVPGVVGVLLLHVTSAVGGGDNGAIEGGVDGLV